MGVRVRASPSGRRDRVLGAIETPALGLWCGALLGFAFISAPLAFRIVGTADVGRFAALTAASIGTLTLCGYALGAVAFIAALLRSAGAAERTADFLRAGLVAVALALATYQQRAIVPEMTATTDVRTPEYRALHARSTAVYGGVTLLVLIALIASAARREE
jgi:hypothetical protein